MIKVFDSGEGIILTPSFHGESCLGNGDHPGLECCCDECDFYLYCFPEWDTAIDAFCKN